MTRTDANKLSNCLKIVFKYSASSACLYFIFSILLAVLPAVALVFTENLIDAIANFVTEYASILLWSALLFLSLILIAVFAHINAILKIHISKKLSVQFTHDYYEHLTNLEYSAFENADAQDTISRLGNSLYEKFADLYEIICAVVSALLGVVAYTALFAQASLWVLLVFPFIAVGIFLIDSKNFRIMKDLQDRQSLDERFASYLEKLCINKHALFELKVFGSASYIIDLFTAKSKKLHNEMRSQYVKLQRNLFFGTIIAIFWITIIIYFLCSAIIDSRITIGLFSSLIGGAYSLITSIQSFSYLSSVFSQEAVIIEHYKKLLAYKKCEEKSGIIVECLNKIEFRNVSFSYPNSDLLVLNDLSFIVNPQSTTALVGKNGSGKSTIIKLLLKLYEPTSGEILINENKLQDIKMEELKRLFAVAFQDFVQYNLTLKENLTLGNRNINDKQLNDAIDNYFPNQDLQLNTMLGKYTNSGRDLSLGQWQRILLCRLSLSPSKLLILDEPTASLDPIAESDFYSSFQNVLNKKGSIVISHRLASAKMADTILVIDEGKLIQQGTHNDIVSNPGLYQDMWKHQSSWYTEDAI